MKRRARIAWVVPTMRVGGTERQLLHLLRGLSDDFELTVICTRSEGALIGDARRAGAYVRVLDYTTAWDFRMRRRLYRVLSRHRPDILHTFLSGFDLYANQAAVRAGVPVIISSRRELAVWQKRRHLWMQRRANRLVDAIVANSRAVAEYAAQREGMDPARYRVIHNGIDVAQYRSALDQKALRARFKIPLDTQVVGMVANFTPVKDHRLFLDMAEHLVKRHPKVYFLLVGTGPLCESIRRHMGRRFGHDRFARMSTVGEVADLLGAMDMFVLTSKVEGFPNAIMEAMAARTPVVSAMVGGVVELIRHEETGLLVDSRDPGDFAAAITRLLDDAPLRARLGEAAGAWIEQHLTMDRMLREHRQLYHELLRKKLGQGP